MSSPSQQPQKIPESTVGNNLSQAEKDYINRIVSNDPGIRIKRPRLMPNLSSQPEPTNNLTKTTDLDSDEELVCSSQPKSNKTIGKAFASSEAICDNYYDSDSSFSSNFSQNEGRNLNSTCHYKDSNLSDSSSLSDYMAEKTSTMSDEVFSDNGYLPSNSDVQVTKATIPKTNLPLPARFKTCVQCRKQNSNPYFQYCCQCFKLRVEFFGKNPNAKRKRVRYTRDESELENFQESSLGLSCEFSSQKKNNNTKNIETSKAEVDEDTDNLCNICFNKPKNGVFNHGNIAHIYCCYSCAKLLWKKSNKCPLCNAKIKFVTKLLHG